MELPIQYIRDVEPVVYKREGDAALDLRATDTWVIDLDNAQKEIQQSSYTLHPGERVLIKTGVIFAIPPGHWGTVRDRSGLAMNHGLHCLGGVIDENYRGEICVVMINLGTKEIQLNKNDRVAQIIIQPYARVITTKVEQQTTTSRQEQGFGSSGKQ